jgi:hypothetical protein
LQALPRLNRAAITGQIAQICVNATSTDTKLRPAPNGGSARVLSSLLITAGVVDAAKRRDFIDVIARMFTSSRGTDSSRQQ